MLKPAPMASKKAGSPPRRKVTFACETGRWPPRQRQRRGAGPGAGEICECEGEDCWDREEKPLWCGDALCRCGRGPCNYKKDLRRHYIMATLKDAKRRQSLCQKQEARVIDMTCWFDWVERGGDFLELELSAPRLSHACSVFAEVLTTAAFREIEEVQLRAIELEGVWQ